MNPYNMLCFCLICSGERSLETHNGNLFARHLGRFSDGDRDEGALFTLCSA